jgi:hypothetical protein
MCHKLDTRTIILRRHTCDLGECNLVFYSKSLFMSRLLKTLNFSAVPSDGPYGLTVSDMAHLMMPLTELTE